MIHAKSSKTNEMCLREILAIQLYMSSSRKTKNASSWQHLSVEQRRRYRQDAAQSIVGQRMHSEE